MKKKKRENTAHSHIFWAREIPHAHIFWERENTARPHYFRQLLVVFFTKKISIAFSRNEQQQGYA
jgi:hypothetical protein